jgi:hypothetical protein
MPERISASLQALAGHAQPTWLVPSDGRGAGQLALPAA